MMGRADEAAVLDFAKNLPTHDLLFLPRNISQPKVLSAWINEIEPWRHHEPARRERRQVVAPHAVRDPRSWSPLSRKSGWGALDVRGQGVGGRYRRDLRAGLVCRVGEAFGQMTVTAAAAIALFESLGFRPSAAARHVQDVGGKKHDIVVLGHTRGAGPGTNEATDSPEAVQH